MRYSDDWLEREARRNRRWSAAYEAFGWLVYVGVVGLGAVLWAYREWVIWTR